MSEKTRSESVIELPGVAYICPVHGLQWRACCEGCLRYERRCSVHIRCARPHGHQAPCQSADGKEVP